MDRQNLNIGKIGEDAACRFLEEKGLKILKRNVRVGKKRELDIIAREKSGVLVFVEVKTGTSNNPAFAPEFHYNSGKRFQINRAATVFAAKHPKWIFGERGWRIDLITIFLDNCQVKDIRHYENVA